jgi:phosphoglycerate dehydrogenase-like enzyme
MAQILVLSKIPRPSLIHSLSLAHPQCKFVPVLPETAVVPAGSDAIIHWGADRPQLRRAIEASSATCRWFHTAFAGLDGVLPEVLDCPGVLTNGKGVFSSSLAEWVLFAILSHAKNARALEANKRAKVYAYDTTVNREVRDMSVAIVGYGDIGVAVAGITKAVGMRVVPVTRTQGQYTATDFVVAALPSTPETRHFFDRRAFQSFKPGAFFINVGRGSTVDEEALVESLRSGHLSGAALDVFETEPLPPSSPLWDLENVIISPHRADHTDRADEDVTALIKDNVNRFLEGHPLRNIVKDRARGY